MEKISKIIERLLSINLGQVEDLWVSRLNGGQVRLTFGGHRYAISHSGKFHVSEVADGCLCGNDRAKALQGRMNNANQTAAKKHREVYNIVTQYLTAYDVPWSPEDSSEVIVKTLLEAAAALAREESSEAQMKRLKRAADNLVESAAKLSAEANGKINNTAPLPGPEYFSLFEIPGVVGPLNTSEQFWTLQLSGDATLSEVAPLLAAVVKQHPALPQLWEQSSKNHCFYGRDPVGDEKPGVYTS